MSSSRRAASRLLQALQAGQAVPWSPGACLWAAAAGVRSWQRSAAAVTASSAATAGGWRCLSAEASAAGTDSSAAATTLPPSTGSGSQKPSQQRARSSGISSKQQEALALQALSFDALRSQMVEQLDLRNCQGEARLLALLRKAASAEEVAAAVSLVKRDRLARGRLQQVQACSPALMSALFRAGERVGVGPAFAVELLQTAPQLGLSVSLGACEDTVKAAVKARDYFAAGRAWLCAQLHCGGAGSTARPGASSSRLAWAPSGLIRVHALGVAGWLQAGGASPQHAAGLRRELAELCAELAARGASVPPQLTQALEAPAAEAEAPAEGEAEAAEPPEAPAAAGSS